MNKRIPSFDDYVKSIDDQKAIKESYMSEIDAVRQESANGKEFVKNMKKEMPDVAAKFSDKDLEKFYDELTLAATDESQTIEEAAKMQWVLLQRDNPQLHKPYYMIRGQMSKKDIKSAESPSYGYITALTFDTEEEMKAEIEKLKAEGFRVS